MKKKTDHHEHRKLFTTQDVEKLFQVSMQTIRSWQRDKTYPFPHPLIHAKGGKNLWSQGQLDDFIAQLESRYIDEQTQTTAIIT